METSKAFFFKPEDLWDLAKKNAQVYRSNDPFPHIVIDNFLPPEVLDGILGEFPKPGQIKWIDYDIRTEKKLASREENQMGPQTRHLLSQFNSSTFCRFLEELTGIDGVIPDPHFEGGGLHQIERGGFLKVHVDFNWHEKLQLHRRLNLLLYLNKNWKDDYGGHLELWKTDMSECGKKVLPVFNRCVIFSTTEDSYHGHPDPLTCPEGWTRKSLALYYYTAGKVDRSHTTIFRSRPGESFSGATKDFIKKIVPPFMIDSANFIRKKMSEARR